MKKMNSNKIIALVLSLVVVMGCAIGGTMAWLITETKPVVNTFTYGDINIDLDESGAEYDPEDDQYENEFEMIPGSSITKDPWVTVNKGSEACWLFVKIEKSKNFDEFMTYAIAEGWTELEDAEGVFYREVENNDDFDQSFEVLMNNEVKVKTSVNKEQLEQLEGNYPTLTFTAYAVQRENIETVADAWYYVENPEATEIPTEAPAEDSEIPETTETPEA